MRCPPTPPAPVSRELSRVEGLRLLRNVTFGRIVFISRAKPTIFLVSHITDGECLLIGLSHVPEITALVQRFSHVVYEADVLDVATRLGWSVVLSGRAGLVEDPQELHQARHRLQPWPGEQIDVVMRIHPELVTGFSVSAPDAGATR
ncbi:pyridoxamine 5'-phosphate oxidase family protein [Nonomuraea sp. G32]|nr:pyridoxamine 5'-phosphate oxidase family protein [Nonomuraea sp. G32]MDP4512120.1 pyridoxamine 5'-phosphate oxidase family protein [Nonomuraea sp. G32]